MKNTKTVDLTHETKGWGGGAKTVWKKNRSNFQFPPSPTRPHHEEATEEAGGPPHGPLTDPLTDPLLPPRVGTSSLPAFFFKFNKIFSVFFFVVVVVVPTLFFSFFFF